MSSSSGEFVPQDEPMNPQIPDEGIETAKKVLDLEIDTEDIRRCIGCPLVEACIEKWEGNPDAVSGSAYLRYALEIQKNCKGPEYEPSRIPFVADKPVCQSPIVPTFPKKMRRGL